MIAIVCAIGWLDSHGYQYVYRDCIGSMCEFADKVYLIQSTRDKAGVYDLLCAYPKIVYIADERTWFADSEDAAPVYGFHNRNLAIGMQAATRDGAECIVGMHNNWYIPRRNMAALRARCEATVGAGLAYEWLNRGTQLGSILFHTSHHVKFIVNPKFPGNMIAGKVADKAHKWYPPASEWPVADATMVVDVPLEMTLQDQADYWNWAQCYEGRVGGSKVFDWANIKPLILHDLAHKAVSKDPLDAIGRTIAHNSRPDFVSHIILKEAGLE